MGETESQDTRTYEKPEIRQRDFSVSKEPVCTSNGESIENSNEGTGQTPSMVEKNNIKDKKLWLHIVKVKCTNCCIPCLRSYNQTPQDANLFQKIRHGFMLPPNGNFATCIQFAVALLQIWILLYLLTHTAVLPGKNFFSLLILFVCCTIAGYLIAFTHLPPLLGMLLMGIMLRNIPHVQYVGLHIDGKWSSTLRKIALTVILTRAGLGLDIMKLRKLSWKVIRIAWMPCLAEILSTAIVSHFLIGFPWTWSFMFGCIMGALSPAVTVPPLVNLQDRKFGVVKGIPTVLLAAGGLDNVFCLTAFSIFNGIIFSNDVIVLTVFKGLIGIVLGIVYGCVAGIFLWYIPAKDCTNKIFYRSLILLSSGIIIIFGSADANVQLSGAGPLGCLLTATIAAYRWRKERQQGETDDVAKVMAFIWLIMQNFLFGLIGATVNIGSLKPVTAGLGIATLIIGLTVRSLISFTITLPMGLNLKERIFVSVTWLAKATVQAAIGGTPIDQVKALAVPNPDGLRYATDIVNIAVVTILICAPTASTLMTFLGPKFLAQGGVDDSVKEDQAITNDGFEASETETKIDMVTKENEQLQYKNCSVHL